MRHMSGTDAPDWPDARLSLETGMPLEDLARGQRLLDDVAALVGRPAMPRPRWKVR
jgi:hypothetical protein